MRKLFWLYMAALVGAGIFLADEDTAIAVTEGCGGTILRDEYTVIIEDAEDCAALEPGENFHLQGVWTLEELECCLEIYRDSRSE
jgi:hypothetical protein